MGREAIALTGKTHITLGAAAALLLLHPPTIPGIITAVAGGAVGGRIVDIDAKEMGVDRKKVYGAAVDVLLVIALITLDFFIGDGMCQAVLENRGVKLLGGLAGLLLLAFLGSRTRHRTFTHSLLSMALFSTAVYCLCPPLGIPFLIGYASHLAADLTNRRGLQLFFPLRKKYSLKLCVHNQKANRILFWVTLLFDLAVGTSLAVFALS